MTGECLMLGRWSTRGPDRDEVVDLSEGLDFRHPRYRREVFHRFYEFHLRYRAHPGCVYYLFPYLRETRGWTNEEALWFAFINGNTQNPATSLVIHDAFPNPQAAFVGDLQGWWRDNYRMLQYDTDRRYFRTKFPEAAARYIELTRGNQSATFAEVCGGASAEASFPALWRFVTQNMLYFGRLSAFSYIEYLRIMGVNVQCDSLFLSDRDGSRSHRNGLAKVLGRDDLDWHSSNPEFDGIYDRRMTQWLTSEAATLLDEARARAAGKDHAEDVGYFTLESALCTYKSWHRVNRRYPNVYNDMLRDRIVEAERAHGGRFDDLWAAREASLPRYLRVEDSPHDPGLSKAKQNHYRLTGEIIMMDLDWPCFNNELSTPWLEALT